MGETTQRRIGKTPVSAGRGGRKTAAATEAALESPAPPAPFLCGHLQWLFLIIVVDMLAVGTIVPLITPFTREVGATPSQLGFLSSVYGFTQLLSSPVLGRLSDKMSRRTILVISLIGGAVGYSILGMAYAIWAIVLSRFAVGIFRQTLTISKAWIADLSTPESRGRNLSFFYATVSMGFMVGPALGGQLAKAYGYRYPFLLSAALMFGVAVAVSLLLPAGKLVEPEKKSSGDRTKVDKKGTSWIEDFASLRPDVQKLLFVKLFQDCSVMLSRNGIFMLLEYREEWDFDIANKGLIISLFSFVSVATQLVLVGPITRSFPDRYIIFFSGIWLVVAQLVCALATNFRLFLLGIIVLSVGFAVLKVAMTNSLTIVAGESNRGEVFGVAGSITSLLRGAVPLLSGFLVEWYNPSLPGIVASVSVAVLAILSVFFVPLRKKRAPSSEGKRE